MKLSIRAYIKDKDDKSVETILKDETIEIDSLKKEIVTNFIKSSLNLMDENIFKINKDSKITVETDVDIDKKYMGGIEISGTTIKAFTKKVRATIVDTMIYYLTEQIMDNKNDYVKGIYAV